MRPASLVSNVLGVIVLARNGDRQEYYQDPKSYRASFTETTALGEVQSHQLGSLLRSTYLSSDSPSYIKDMKTDLVDNGEMSVLVKGGGEGTVVFDSAIALLQGLWPPNKKNQITLANDTIVTAPMGGYQYVPVETVNPGNDRSLESWTDCPAFENHIADVYASKEFQDKAKDAGPFFDGVRDYVFGKQLNLENIWNVHDFISTQLTHNKTYAYRLPPSFVEQARGLADFVQDKIFSDNDMNGIGNLAGRTVLDTIDQTLQRIAFNGDPLQFQLIATTYQPFISLFHLTEMTKKYPELKAIPEYGSALAIELRRGAPPDSRDFLRFLFKNGTTGAFEVKHVFGHNEDIPLTEFIYKMQGSAVNNKKWQQICGNKLVGDDSEPWFRMQAVPTGFASSAAFLVGALVIFHLAKRLRARRSVRLAAGDEIIASNVEKSAAGARFV